MEWLKWEGFLYWCALAAAFMGVAVWESNRPKTKLKLSTGKRWAENGALYVLGGLLAALVPVAAPTMIAFAVERRSWGLLNQHNIPLVLRILAAVVLLDLLRYVLHVLNHKVEWLWRLHQVHHSDVEFDVSTTVRSHPLEATLIKVIQAGAVWLWAPPVWGVLIYELLALTHSFFSHANARLPERLRNALQWMVMTPGVHRVHHSVELAEQNRNFGEVFIWWDRLFGTYKESSSAGDGFPVGVSANQPEIGLVAALLSPRKLL